MAYFSPLDDGSYQVETDDGRTLRTALDPSQLMAMGLTEKPAQLEQFDAANTVADLSFDKYDSVGGGAAPPPPPVRADAAGTGRSHAPPSAPAKYNPPQTLEIKPTAPTHGFKQPDAGNERLDALSNLAASQLVRRAAPRAPGGKVQTSETVQTAPVASRADLDTLAETEIGNEAIAMQQAEELHAQRGAALDDAIARNAQREEQLAQQYAKRQATDAKLLELQAHAEQKEREAAEMQTLTPTDSYFKDRGGAWGRLLAGAMIFLGGIGQAFQAAGGVSAPNQGLQAYQAAIKEQADLLKQQHEQAEAAGRTARNAYSEMLQVYGTPEMAYSALLDQGEAIADKKMQLLAMKSGNQDMLNQVMQWQAGRSEQRAARVAERNAAAAGAVTKSYGFDRGSSGGSYADLNWMKFALDVEKTRGDKTDKSYERMVRLPDGSSGMARNATAAKEAQEKIEAGQRVADMTARIRKLRTEPGAKTDVERRRQIQGAVQQLQLAIKQANTLGSWDKGTAEKLDQMTGDPTALVDLGGADALLQEIEESAKSGIDYTKRFQLGIDTAQPSSAQSDE